MWQFFKNLFSYLHFVLSFNRFQLASAIIDILILGYSIANPEKVTSHPSVIALFLAVFVDFVWQIINVIGHFSFLKMEDPKLPLVSMLKKSPDDKKDYSLIKVNSELLKLNHPYEIDQELGVLENPSIDKIISSDKRISLIYSETKRKEIKTYVRQYKEVLLKFLNHRWYEICRIGGPFTNDAKICFVSELYQKEDKTYCWNVTKGHYYVGYLTNFIYTNYIGGSRYKLYPPVNMNTDPIKRLGGSDLLNHIGVSTLLYTKDGYVFYFLQAGNAAYNSNRYMPTGSGSLNFEDYIEGEDLRQMVVRGAERELAEESRIKKLLGEEDFSNHIQTLVIGFYRDMERGGKPEFCCVSYIDKVREEVAGYIQPDKKEIAEGTREAILLDDIEQWSEVVIPQASLSLKMNYKYLKARQYSPQTPEKE